MKKIFFIGLSVFLTGCLSLSTTSSEPDFNIEWFNVLPGENECMVNFIIWAAIPPTGYVSLNDGWSTYTDETTGLEKIAIYGEHSCPDVISYYTKMWENQEKERIYKARQDSGPTFRWSRNIDLDCMCDSESVNKIKKDMEKATEQYLKNKQTLTNDQ